MISFESQTLERNRKWVAHVCLCCSYFFLNYQALITIQSKQPPVNETAFRQLSRLSLPEALMLMKLIKERN